MSAAPATRYTDRDVRESAELGDMALRYVLNYHGDFEFLQDAKQHAQINGSLTVALARGVLNCMRNDARVAAELPPPAYYAEDTVVPMAPKQRKVKKKYELECDDTKPHEQHSWYENPTEHRGGHWCKGVDFPIMREHGVAMALRIKTPYLMSKYARSMIHAPCTEPEEQARRTCLEWYPNRHGWGFKDHGWEGSSLWLTLYVKLRCKYPSILRDPILLTEEHAERMIELGLTWCRHCFPER